MTATSDIPRLVVVPSRHMISDLQRPCVVLVRGQRWNDFGYKTIFHVIYCGSSTDHSLGTVKILRRGEKMWQPVDMSFERLPEGTCSLGQSADYYEKLSTQFGPTHSAELLHRLRDITMDPALDASFHDDEGYQKSLFRSSEALRVYILRTDRSAATSLSSASEIKFQFSCLLTGFEAPHDITFTFYPRDKELGRVNAVIGRNATGKTQLLRELARKMSGLCQSKAELVGAPLFSRAIVVTYSSFDDFQRYEHWKPENTNAVGYYYCGLLGREGGVDVSRSIEVAVAEINTMDTHERARWQGWLEDARLTDAERVLLTTIDYHDAEAATKALGKLSSGHQLLVLLLTNLAMRLRPQSLILFDEPELHLHPNLLSALMRVLHRALTDMESFAIVTTHSPQVLQEIPARSVRILERHGDTPRVRTYPRESFGANLGEIADVAFGVSEERKNYHLLLQTAMVRPERLASVLRLPHVSLPLAAALGPEVVDDEVP